MQGDRRALSEVCGVFLAVAALTWLLSRADFLPLVRDNLHLLVAALFVFTSIRCSERLPGGLPRYGIALGGLLVPDSERDAPGLLGSVVDLLRALLRAVPACLRELGIAVLVCAVVFPPFVAGFYLWHAPDKSFELIPHSQLPSFVLTQIVVVGLPEEMLFRGYIQGRLEDAWPRKVRFLFAELSLPAWLVQAALFAVLHFLVEVHPARLAVFFPALLFGWLRSLRRGIGAAVFVHAFCNLLSDLLARGWL
ncbi:MAG TPA: MrtC family glutamic-type intramembrane protease [Polyangiales bacterium]|nr:MrtC family glutamic-type intramembrane protease [Polyangiales bacterium]